MSQKLDTTDIERGSAGMLQRIRGQGGVLTSAQVGEILESRDATLAELMIELLRTAASYAAPVISGFSVGAVAAGGGIGSGPPALYLGANVEIAGEPLNRSIHAEQAAVFNAWLAGETGISALAVTAAPCGYCRQFLWELAGAGSVKVWSPSAAGEPPRETSLAVLLPDAFGPADLGIEGGLMGPAVHNLRFTDETDDALALQALEAARRSYAPYTRSYSGCGVRTRSGVTVAAPYAESAAFSPSVPPLQVALAVLNLKAAPLGTDPIVRAVLVEADGKISHRNHTRRLLSVVAPDAKFEYHPAA